MHRCLHGTAVISAGVLLALIPAAGVRGQTASSSTADAAPLARYVPREGLEVYFEFPGLAGPAAAWHNTATYKILNTTPTGAMLEDALAQLVDKTPGGISKGALTGADVVALIKHVAQNGLVLAQAARPEAPEKPIHLFVLKGLAGGKEIRPITGRLLGWRMGRDAKLQSVTKGAQDRPRDPTGRGGRGRETHGSLGLVGREG